MNPQSPQHKLINSSSYPSFNISSPTNLQKHSPPNSFDFSPSNLPPKVSAKKLQHMNCIFQKSEEFGGLYIGDTISTLKDQLLAENKIQAVLCCNDQAKNHLKKYPLLDRPRFRHIPIEDNQIYPISAHFPQALEFIEQERQNNRNVLIQCHAGVSRSGTILCAYLIWKNKWTLNQAYQFVTSKRPRIKPNQKFWEQLLKYEDQILQIKNIENNQKNQSMFMTPHKNKTQTNFSQNLESTKNSFQNNTASVSTFKCEQDLNPESQQHFKQKKQTKGQLEHHLEKIKLPQFYYPQKDQILNSPSHQNYPITISPSRKPNDPIFSNKSIPNSFCNSPIGISQKSQLPPNFFMSMQKQTPTSFESRNNNIKTSFSIPPK